MQYFNRAFVSFALAFSCIPLAFGASPSPGSTLKLIVPRGYLPQAPLVVRVEVIASSGDRDRDFWDGEATLSSDSGTVTLSTNKVTLRNGLGNALVTFSGTGNFNLSASVGSLTASRSVTNLTAAPVTSVGGTLPGSSTTWSGVVRITNDVTVPVGHTLTVRSNTLIVVNGVSSGTTASDLIVNGTVNTEGTEDNPIA